LVINNVSSLSFLLLLTQIPTEFLAVIYTAEFRTRAGS
jgi:hypothetical protein